MLHGTEYLLLSTQMVRRSNPSRALILILALLSFGGAFALAHFLFIGAYGAKSSAVALPSIRPLALKLYLAVLYLHYYVDSVIYKLRDQQVQAHMGPLMSDALELDRITDLPLKGFIPSEPLPSAA